MSEILSHDSDCIAALVVAEKPRSVKFQLIQVVREADSWSSVWNATTRRERDRASEVLQICAAGKISVIPFLSEHYPPLLREIPDPPAAIFLRSTARVPSFGGVCIGVVGTRSATVGMCQRTSALASDLVGAGITVVSGMALGIDGAAHRGALAGQLECPTIAVLAHGLDRIYPSSHSALAEAIIRSGGILLSEYPPGTEPLKHQFLARNRIIAGLSRGVVVIQAGARSGSLVTANCAADFGRDVFVLDADLESEINAGGLSLVEQGAIPIRRALDILGEYGMASDDSETAEGRMTGGIIEVSLKEIASMTGLSTADILRMEIAGTIQRLSSNVYLIQERVLKGLQQGG